MAVVAENIPECLRRLDRWLVWSWEWRPKKNSGQGGWDKPPLGLYSGRHIDKTDPANWHSFEVALAAHRRGDFDGLGIALGDIGDDGPTLSGTDLDDVRDPTTGTMASWASWVTARLGTYAEVSPSGTGVKLFAWGKLPKGRRADHETGIEMYDGGSYFCVTGRHLEGSPTEVMERTEALTEVHRLFLEKAGGTAAETHLSDSDLALSALAGLGRNRAATYHDWIGVGMALHAVADDLLGAWEDWSRSCPEKYVDGECRCKWKGFSRDGGITLGTLIHWARQDGWKPPSRNSTSHSSNRTSAHAGHQDSRHADSANIVPVGPLVLTPDQPRRTPSGKLTLMLSVHREGRLIDSIPLSSTPSGRTQAGKIIAQHLGGGGVPDARVKIDLALAGIIASASEAMSRGPTVTGVTMRQVIASKVIEDFGLTHRTDTGAWSERRRAEVRRQDFIVTTSSDLLDAAAEAVDAPRNEQGQVIRLALIRAVEAELKVVWADLLRTLPVASEAGLTEQSAAARKFRDIIYRAWTMPATWETSTDGHAKRASVISRAKTLIDQHNRGGGSRRQAGTRRWVRVHDACSAWWRLHVTREGELLTLLAMRYELPGQLKINLPGVVNQKEFIDLGVKFGVVAASSPVPLIADRGTNRLAVLSPAITAELLDVADEQGDPARADDDDAAG
jgi:hypothetical protein